MMPATPLAPGEEALKNVIAWEEIAADFPAPSVIPPGMLEGGRQEPFPPASALLLLGEGRGLKKQAPSPGPAWLGREDALPGMRGLGRDAGDVCQGDRGKSGDRAREIPVAKGAGCKAQLVFREHILAPTARGKEPGTRCWSRAPQGLRGSKLSPGPGRSAQDRGGGEQAHPCTAPRAARARGGNETSSCICLHQKCTHRCKPKPTHARISAPTRARTRIDTPVHAHEHRRVCKHGVCTHVPMPTCTPSTHKPRINVLFSGCGGGKTQPTRLPAAQGRNAACSCLPSPCQISPHRDLDAAPHCCADPHPGGLHPGVTRPRGSETEEKRG